MAVDLIVLIAALAGLASVAAYTLITGVPPTPTSPKVREAILAALPALPEGVVYDAGSGFGGLAFALARRYPNRPVVGIEVSPLPWLVAWFRIRIAGPGNLAFRRADLRGVPLADAGLVVCYLSGPAMTALKAKLETEAPAGCVVVSNTFAVPGWTPDRVAIASDLYGTKIYVYRVGPSPSRRSRVGSLPLPHRGRGAG